MTMQNEGKNRTAGSIRQWEGWIRGGEEGGGSGRGNVKGQED